MITAEMLKTFYEQKVENLLVMDNWLEPFRLIWKKLKNIFYKENK